MDDAIHIYYIYAVVLSCGQQISSWCDIYTFSEKFKPTTLHIADTDIADFYVPAG